MISLIVTFFYVGRLPWVPGTWGSLATIPLMIALHQFGSFAAVLGATVLLFFLGWWATYEDLHLTHEEDPSEIVIDEVVGQLIALWPVSFGAMIVGVEAWRLWPGILTAFIFFRIFDISKVGPVGWADRKSGPFWVMLDDVIAGFAAIVLVGIFAAASHWAMA